VRSTAAHAILVLSISVIAFGLMGASPVLAQTRVSSLDELRRVLDPGDMIVVVPSVGEPVAGRLTRLGDAHLDLRVVDTRISQGAGARNVSIALDAIRSIERRRDPVRNGATIGAGIGAGFGGAMFLYGSIIDRNELEEWAPLYLGVAAVCTGIGALIGWAIDAANSKPHIKFESFTHGRTTIAVQPIYSRGRGIALGVVVSRW
jgi:hypothetical protein